MGEIIAVFDAPTGWAGRQVTYENGALILAGVGAIAPDHLLQYERQGQIDWAHAGMRDWVVGLTARVAEAQSSAAVPTTATTVAQIPARETSQYCGQYAQAFDAGRIIEIFEDSRRIALSSKNPETAHSRFELAVEAYHQIMSMKVPGGTRTTIHSEMQGLVDAFPYQVVVNEALELREKAQKLKTPSRRLDLLNRAAEVIEQGRSQNSGNAMLEQAAADVRNEIAQVEAAGK